jgi:hypothetical protein
MTSVSSRKYELFLFLLILFVLCTVTTAFAADSEKTVIAKYPSFAGVVKTVKETVRSKDFDLLKVYTVKNGRSQPPYWLPESQEEPETITYDQYISNMKGISEGVLLTLTGKYEIWNQTAYPVIDIETIGWQGNYKTVFLRFAYWDTEKVWILMGSYLTSERMK